MVNNFLIILKIDKINLIYSFKMITQINNTNVENN
jgi:hypothetical protein